MELRLSAPVAFEALLITVLASCARTDDGLTPRGAITVTNIRLIATAYNSRGFIRLAAASAPRPDSGLLHMTSRDTPPPASNHLISCKPIPHPGSRIPDPGSRIPDP